ncbi:DUF2867 domain-containing protein [Bacteroidota bacterium]
MERSNFDSYVLKYILTPDDVGFKDKRKIKIENPEIVLEKIWALGGENGWYYANWLWKLRGFLDKIFGGVGLKRGRTSNTTISAGDILDFWRVLIADKQSGRLLLFSEMRMPGYGWLEFKVENQYLSIITTYKPIGIFGKLYWYIEKPLHDLIFKNLIKLIGSPD